MGTGFTRPHGGRLMILPVDQDVGALPRQTWIDFCAVLASVLRRDSPREPAKTERRCCGRSRSDAQVSDSTTKY